MHKKLRGIGCLIFFSFLLSGCASPINHEPQVQTFIQQTSTKENISKTYLENVFSHVHIDHAVLKSMQKPKEFSTPWYKYRAIFVQPARAQSGAQFWTAHTQAFNTAYRRYGVPPQMIAAILGVETNYGKNLGTFKAIDALSTLAFAYPPRAHYFQYELAQYLVLTQQLHLDPLTLQSSYAGAVGFPQFMPSSYRFYAVSATGQNAADLWHNPDDAIMSIANYFHHFGWQKGQPVAVHAIVSGNRYHLLIHTKELHAVYTVRQLRRFGIRPAKYLAPNTRVNFLIFDTRQGPQYWLALHNFYVITRYNASTFYAMAAFQLSELIYAQH